MKLYHLRYTVYIQIVKSFGPNPNLHTYHNAITVLWHRYNSLWYSTLMDRYNFFCKEEGIFSGRGKMEKEGMVRELRAQVIFLRDQVQGVSTTPGQIRSSGRTHEKLQEFPGATIWSLLLKKLRKNLLILAAEISTHHWKAYWTVFNNWYAFIHYRYCQ